MENPGTPPEPARMAQRATYQRANLGEAPGTAALRAKLGGSGRHLDRLVAAIPTDGEAPSKRLDHRQRRALGRLGEAGKGLAHPCMARLAGHADIAWHLTEHPGR